jgi:uncharacterized membrane protein/predicted DsbA family dithiol-disulfide isomerase
MSALARKLLLGFGLLGLVASGASTYVHYNLLKNPAYTSFCDINATVSCGQAYLSRYGSIAGVPVAIGGLAFFLLVLMLVWGSAGRSRIADSAPAYIFAASTVALAVVLYLAYASFFILKAVCPLRVATYVAVVGIFVISGGASSLPMTSLPKRASRDLRVLVTTPVALIIALVFLGGATSAVALFPREESRSVRAQQATPITDQQRSEFEKWWEMQPRVQVPYTAEGAKVVVVKFNDYQCPPCKQTYEAYEPILSKYEARGVKYIMRHFPLNPQCNAAVKAMVHTAACDAAAAAVMAKPKGTYDKLTAWFFANQETLSPATVRDAARSVGEITDFDAQYEKAIQEVKTDASTGAVLGVTSTPTFFVNGRMLKGGLPAQYFEEAIELELKHGDGLK